MALVDPDPTRRALGFDPAALSAPALIEAGYTALADDGFGGTELELRDSRGELVDHPDGTPAKVAFDDHGVPLPSGRGLEALGARRTAEQTGHPTGLATAPPTDPS